MRPCRASVDLRRAVDMELAPRTGTASLHAPIRGPPPCLHPPPAPHPLPPLPPHSVVSISGVCCLMEWPITPHPFPWHWRMWQAEAGSRHGSDLAVPDGTESLNAVYPLRDAHTFGLCVRVCARRVCGRAGAHAHDEHTRGRTPTVRGSGVERPSQGEKMSFWVVSCAPQ